MKRAFMAAVAVAVAVVLYGFASWAEETAIKEGDFVTVCKTGKKCGKMELGVLNPKDCKCGAYGEKMHVLKVEGEVAVLCQCGGMCSCDLNEKNPYLCGCGSPVKVVRIHK